MAMPEEHIGSGRRLEPRTPMSRNVAEWKKTAPRQLSLTDQVRALFERVLAEFDEEQTERFLSLQDATSNKEALEGNLWCDKSTSAEMFREVARGLGSRLTVVKRTGAKDADGRDIKRVYEATHVEISRAIENTFKDRGISRSQRRALLTNGTNGNGASGEHAPSADGDLDGDGE